jgi:hypothetical protein
MYKQTVNTFGGEPVCVIRTTDGACVPFDPANTDYQAYLKWLDGYELQEGGWVKTSQGNTPLPADEQGETNV